MLRRNAAKVASIISAAGGEIVGRTRLQKIVYLLHLAGYVDTFSFGYKHYGPYSEGLANATRYAGLLGLLTEEKNPTGWGGTYSTYSTSNFESNGIDQYQQEILRAVVDVDAVELELMATALFLASEENADPWTETERRKPEKSGQGRLDKARELFEQIKSIDVAHSWPTLQ